MSQANKRRRFQNTDDDCEQTRHIADFNSRLHNINNLLDVEDCVQDSNDLAIDVPLYNSAAAINHFNNVLHSLQNGAGCSDLLANSVLDTADIDRLVREGGTYVEYTITPRPKFNSLILHRPFNFRTLETADMAAYVEQIHNTLVDIVEFSKTLAGENGVFNITLRGGSLTMDVNVMLTPENGYSVESFLGAIERVLQSNAKIMTDDNLELTVSITRCVNGGAYRKLRDLVHNDIIRKNKMNLFCPTNITNKLCFAICLAHSEP